MFCWWWWILLSETCIRSLNHEVHQHKNGNYCDDWTLLKIIMEVIFYKACQKLCFYIFRIWTDKNRTFKDITLDLEKQRWAFFIISKMLWILFFYSSFGFLVHLKSVIVNWSLNILHINWILMKPSIAPLCPLWKDLHELCFSSHLLILFLSFITSLGCGVDKCITDIWSCLTAGTFQQPFSETQ